MARAARGVEAGLMYHAMNRGNGGGGKGVTTEYAVNDEFDDLGRLTRTYTGDIDHERASVAGDGKTITDTRYAYDALGRLRTVTSVEQFDAPMPATVHHLAIRRGPAVALAFGDSKLVKPTSHHRAIQT